MNFLCIPNFNKELIKLTKHPKLGYGNCLNDILKEFDGNTIDEAVLKGSNLNYQSIPMNGKKWWYKKTRIQNSKNKQGKSGSYRFYYLISEDAEIIILLTVYPKAGKYQKITLKHKEEEELLDTFIREKDDLLKYNSETKKFEPMVKEPVA